MKEPQASHRLSCCRSSGVCRTCRHSSPGVPNGRFHTSLRTGASELFLSSLMLDRDPNRGGCTTLKYNRLANTGGSSPRAPSPRRAHATSGAPLSSRETGDVCISVQRTGAYHALEGWLTHYVRARTFHAAPSSQREADLGLTAPCGCAAVPALIKHVCLSTVTPLSTID